jgi:hypothetical protein
MLEGILQAVVKKPESEAGRLAPGVVRTVDSDWVRMLARWTPIAALWRAIADSMAAPASFGMAGTCVRAGEQRPTAASSVIHPAFTLEGIGRMG